MMIVAKNSKNSIQTSLFISTFAALAFSISTLAANSQDSDANISDEEQSSFSEKVDDLVEKEIKGRARKKATKEAIDRFGGETLKKIAAKVPGLTPKTPIPFLVFLQWFGQLTIAPNTVADATITGNMTPEERASHRNLASQTTGLASPIGDARTQREAEELQRLLATTPDGPFVATVESPSGVSTGGFTGEEGLNIAGVLNVFAFDSGSLQDGDRVRLTVRDSRGVILSSTITLTFSGRTSRVSARRGLVSVTITALNEGDSPPNTGGLRVSGDIAGSRSGNFNLTTGASGTLAVRVLGN